MSLRIYTRTGDDGSTGLFGGQRVAKTDLRIEANGAVDELNAQLGVAVASCDGAGLRETLLCIQHQLFALGADLSTPNDDSLVQGRITVDRIGGEFALWLESRIDALEEDLPPLRNFILPGGSKVAAIIHVCRSACRRAERCVVALAERDVTNPEIVRYLNRLSDFLFVLARAANAYAGVEDIPWSKDGHAPASDARNSGEENLG